MLDSDKYKKKFLLIIDEVTFVKDWDRVIKALADEGLFEHGLCILTGSDCLILKEAAQRFPGRRAPGAHGYGPVSKQNPRGTQAKSQQNYGSGRCLDGLKVWSNERT